MALPVMRPMPPDQVRQLQRILKAQGLLSGPVNGRYDQRTTSAVRRFQQRNNLPVTGQYDSATSGLLRDTLQRMAIGSRPIRGIDEETQRFIRETYGYLTLYLRHPEIGPIIAQAARERWDDLRLNSRLRETRWWNTHTASERNWMQLRFDDPAAARRERTRTEGIIRDQAFRLGLELRPRRLSAIVEDAIMQQWSTEEIADALADEAHFRGNDQPSGSMANDMRTLAELRRRYLLPANERADFRIARRIVRGEVSIEDLETEFSRRAAKNNPHLADDINKGLSIEDLFDSHIQAIADELELDADSIDLTDPRWSDIVDFTDENGKRRAMTVGEARLKARKQPGFRRTAAARRDGASLAMMIGRSFGAFG